MIRLFYFILSHSFFIALCATALSFQTGQLTGISTNPYLLSFIFFGTLSGYNAYWLISKFSFSSSNSFRLLFSSSRISLFVFIMALVGMLFCYLQMNLFSSSLSIAGG